MRLAPGEAARVAGHLGMDERAFVAEHCELHPDRRSLMLQSRPNGECIFLEGHNVCRIQAVKPVQCGGFPNAWRFDGWRKVCEAIAVTPPA